MGAPPGQELRSAPRHALLIRTAKIIADGREFLCLIRDASATGLKNRLFSRLPAACELVVELVNGDRQSVELVWQAEDYAGLRFAEAIRVERLLDENRKALPRAVRFGSASRWTGCFTRAVRPCGWASGISPSKALASNPISGC